MNQIQTAAQQYAAIHAYVRTLTKESPKTANEIYEHLRDKVRNKQQVVDCIKKLQAVQQVCYVREGIAYIYWHKVPGVACSIATPPDKPQKHSPVQVITPADIPKIHVTESRITISHSRYEITVELK